MRLRPRLALTTVAVTVPMVLALVWFDAVARHRAAEQLLARATLGQVASRRAACEADPTWGGVMPPPDGPPDGFGPDRAREARARARESGARAEEDGEVEGPPDRFGGPPDGPRKGPPVGERPHGAPPELFAYDEQLRSRDPAAPVLATDLLAGLDADGVAVVPTRWWSSAVEVLVRTPWGAGPCAHVLARGTTVPGWLGILPATRIWLAPLLVVFAAVLLAIGPVVRRIRRLTDAARRSAAAGYTGEVPVEGSDELAELARAFDAAGREVRGREQALRRFLADTTHDVMIPLTVLQGHLAALRERVDGDGRVDPATVVAAMHEAHYIAAIVHNLAVAARLEGAALQLQRGPVDLVALVERVVGRHRPIARQLQVELESAPPAEPLTTDADVTMLEQAVSNVVYNAIRHNRPGGHVAVILEPRGAGGFNLRVLDDGPGLSAAEFARLAERGFRGDAARTRAPAGQGLGLDITRRVAALHGLSLTFQPSEFGGLQVDLADAGEVRT